MTAPTEPARFKPRFWKYKTAGFNPAARNSETMIKIKTALAEASACSTVRATSAPAVTINPK
ncbi:unannotated protein [freshwater metagenome]|uniref:Unannotated protein n=1 Tax=freshwater metagenome TaxID=449393 RepID=A0A6J7LID0_9ZZZZ